MTTQEIHEWADTAVTVYRESLKGEKITLQSAIARTKPKDIYTSPSDYEFAVSLATLKANRNDKQEVTQFTEPERELVAAMNRDAMVAVLDETKALIPVAEFSKWRPTQRISGLIDGMPVGVTCVATDGNLGLFIPNRDDGHNLGLSFIGHVHRFRWVTGEEEVFGAPPILFSVKKPSEIKPKKPKKKTLKQILKEL